MNKKFLILSVLAFFSVAVFAQDPAVGYWKSIDDKDGRVTGIWQTEVKADGLLYGCLLWVPDESPAQKATLCTKVNKYAEFDIANPADQLLVKTPWLYKLRFVSTGVWNKGHIIDPSDGNHYYGGVTFKNGTLIMRGSLDKRGILGRSQVWQTISKAEVDKLVASAKAKYGLK